MRSVKISRQWLLGSLALLWAAAGPLWAADPWLDDQPEFLNVDQAFVFDAEADADGNVVARWTMPDGYYLYRERFAAETRDGTAVQLAEPLITPGKQKVDEYFGAVQVYYHSAELFVPVTAGRGPTEIGISYQGCADYGLCYPPETRWVTLNVNGSGTGAPDSGSYAGRGLERLSAAVSAPQDAAADSETLAPVASGPAVTAGAAAGAAADAGPVTEEQRLAGLLASGSLLSALLIFFAGGLALAFTPCVLPMVPILSSIIVGESGQSDAGISRGRSFSLSLAYVIGMASTYAVLGVLVGLFGAKLNVQAALQSPAVLVSFAAVFAILSLSMFGFYELQLPQGLQSRLNDLGGKVGGGKHLSVLVMGSLSALVVSPCVSAPLAGALIYLSTTSDAVLGGAALLALGLGMGVPLLLIGASGGHLLPRAGAWMNGVKAVFGVLLLAVAIWLLERVIAPQLTLALWAALAIGSAVYLRALDLSPASGWGQFRKAGGAFALVYGVLLLIGAASGAEDPLRPLARLAGGESSAAVAVARAPGQETGAWLAVNDLADVDAQLARAAARGEPVLLDLYADWCISCKVMERSVFPKPQVAALLNRFRLLRADVTANSPAHKDLMARYGLFGPPSMVFFSEDGVPIKEVTLQGELGADAFAGHLALVLDRAVSSEATNFGEIAANVP
jgi:thiol:disulfide interchange protein DsbD